MGEAFWVQVEKTDTCWVWRGVIDRRYGYGRYGRQKAHRVAYEAVVGPIPDRLVLDHLCHTNDPSCPGGVTCPHRRCVNPAHLEAVTTAENVRRARQRPGGNNGYGLKTHCRNGHEYTPDNTYRWAGGGRTCRTCNRASAARTQRARLDRLERLDRMIAVGAS